MAYTTMRTLAQLFNLLQYWNFVTGTSLTPKCQDGTTLDGKTLQTPPLISYQTVATWDDCMAKCFALIQCQSLNYFPYNQTCQTLPENHHDNENMLLSTTGAVYMTNPSHPCTSQPPPCSSAGKCIGEASSERFACQCLDGFTGQRCEMDNRIHCPPNAALERPTAQSSLAYNGFSKNAVDGNTNAKYRQRSCTHTASQTDPWWRVALDSSCFISHFDIANRIDCCFDRLRNFEIRVGDSLNNDGNDNPKCGDLHSVGPEIKRIRCDPPLKGKYLNIRIPGARKILTLCEVIVNP